MEQENAIKDDRNSKIAYIFANWHRLSTSQKQLLALAGIRKEGDVSERISK